ncbi:MAG: hypothetical protein HOB26_10825 [Flavobacteriales bacterium]|nr:hypothetical protein [Flavobacteriales bacterium]
MARKYNYGLYIPEMKILQLSLVLMVEMVGFSRAQNRDESSLQIYL